MRTLYYVPLIHQDWECNAEMDPKYTPPTEEEAAFREEFLGKYWEYISQQLLKRVGSGGLIQSQTEIDLDLFRESWVSRRSIEQSKEHMAYGASIGDPMSKLLISMLSYNVRAHVTESRFAHEFEWVMLRTNYQYERLQRFCQSLRDRAIAANLNRLVKDGNTAVLFIGASHDVPAYLDAHWKVEVITTLDILFILNAIDTRRRRWVDLYLKEENLTDKDIQIDTEDVA